MNHKITTISIQVPYKSAGGAIFQHPVVFDVYERAGHYSLRPQLDEEGLRLANLPEELKFVMEGGNPVSLRGKIDGNFHVIEDAVAQLKGTNQLV